MGIKIITAPSLEPITLTEAKLQCNCADTSDYDTILTAYIAAARAKAENHMSAAIMQRTLDQTIDRFPLAGEADINPQVIPAWAGQHTISAPLSITSFSYVDSAGDTQTLTADDYSLDDNNWPFWVVPAVDTQWPTARDQANALTIRWTVGYDTTAKVPPDIRAWLLLTVAFLFAQRESFDLGGRTAEIPSRFVDAMLDPYRLYSV